MEEKFSLEDAIKTGWELTKKHFWFLVGLLVVVFLIGTLASGIANIFRRSLLLYIPIFFLVLVFRLLVQIGMLRIVLDIYDTGKGELGKLFSQGNLLGKYIVGTILYGLIVIVGFLLLIIPGIIWSIKYQYFSLLIIDKGMGPMEALKKAPRSPAARSGIFSCCNWSLLS